MQYELKISASKNEKCVNREVKVVDQLASVANISNIGPEEAVIRLEGKENTKLLISVNESDANGVVTLILVDKEITTGKTASIDIPLPEPKKTPAK